MALLALTRVRGVHHVDVGEGVTERWDLIIRDPCGKPKVKRDEDASIE